FHWVSDEEPEVPVKAPPSPNYVPGPEHPPSPDYVPGPDHPPLPDYVPRPEYPEYLVPVDDEAPIEDQPLPVDASPTALSSGYVADSDLEEHPENDLADYPADGGDKEEESFGDYSDDKDEEKASEDNDKDEEEHLASVDSSVVPVVDPVPSAEDTEAFETDESTPTPPSPRPRKARISVRLEPPMVASIEACIDEYVVAPTPPLPPPSPLTPLSTPLPQIPSLPLRLPSPPIHTSPTYVEASLGYRVARIRDDLPKADMPLRKRAYFTTPTGRFEVGESLSVAARQAGHTLAYRVDYGFIDTVDASICAAESRAITAIWEVNERVTDLATTQRQDGQELYKMPPKRSVITTTPKPMTDAQIKVLIAQGVADALAEIKANRTSRNGDDSHDLRNGSRKTERAARECTDVLSYNQRFQELALTCSRMFPEESDKVEKRSIPLLTVKLKTRGNLMTLQRTTRTNSSLSKGIMWQGPILLGLGKRKCMGDLNLCALNETTIMMGSLLPSAPTIRGLAIWPGTVEASLLLPTTREPQGQIKGVSLALSMELRAITRGIA
ncbi:hypothetical protein Tco_1150148, partial [Tanacetum coccineum]